MRLGRGRIEGEGPGARRAVLVSRSVDRGALGWGAMIVAEERCESVLGWAFDPESFRKVALKEKLDSRLCFAVKGSDVGCPESAWLCRLKIGILDLLAWRLVSESLRRPLRDKDRNCWEASLSPWAAGFCPFVCLVEGPKLAAFLSGDLI